jgi:vitamin K-dependent gamma-carboxylase-like protein
VQPLPSPALHVGLMLIVGGLAWVVACTGGSRLLRALLVVLYTYGWAMSRLDGYQHHYLISLLLAGFVFFPRLAATDVVDRGRISAWPYVLLGANVAIVYVFAAVTKTEAGWASGAVLRQITQRSPWFQSVWQWVRLSGLSDDVLWGLVARAVTVMQVLIAVAYVVVPRGEGSGARWVRLLAWAAFLAAAGFHGSLLLFTIEIRWFGYYMIALAAAFFLPERALNGIVRLVSLPIRTLAQRAAEWRFPRWWSAAVVLSAASVVALVGARLDVPGATVAGAIGAAALALVGILAALGIRPSAAPRTAIAVATGALALAAAVHVVPVRFQYYLYIVADRQRRGGDPRQVLAAYERAERYAPPGESRQRQIEALRRSLVTERRVP